MTDPTAMKTAATVLQELMMKRGRMPEYECINQSGLKHQTVFEYICVADGVSVRASARSKKDAKQAVAKRALAALAARGDIIPPPYNIPLDDYAQGLKCIQDPQCNLQQHEDVSLTEDNAPPEKKCKKEEGEEAGSSAVPSATSYVALLKELCELYSLAAPEYCLVSDTGPPHQRRFTISASVGKNKCLATANNKRAARQAAADLLYRYLRKNLARVTEDFNEEEALVRAHEKAMDRFVEVTSDQSAWRPNLGQVLADYHLGLRNSITEEQRLAALATLESGDTDFGVARALEAAGLTAQASMLGDLCVLSVPHAAPPLAFAGKAPGAAQRANQDAAIYLKFALTALPS